MKKKIYIILAFVLLLTIIMVLVVHFFNYSKVIEENVPETVNSCECVC